LINSTGNIIEINNFKKTFGIFEKNAKKVKALDDVSLSIKEGEIFGIVGYSGAGKSTLVRCFNLLEVPDEGSMDIKNFGTITFKKKEPYLTSPGGKRASKMGDKQLGLLRKDMGMIFQHFNLLDRSTVFDNVAYPLKYCGKTKEEINDRVLDLLNLVGLSDKAKSYPSELSGGQKQRVAIARALANNPKILLSDEATSALDPDATESVLKLLKDLNKKLGITIILITHEMAVIKSVCDRVAVMEEGKIVECGSSYEIFANPKMPITKNFVESSSGVAKFKSLLEDNPLLFAKGTLLKLSYDDQIVEEALISYTSRTFQVDINILFGTMELVQGKSFGNLVVQVIGDKEKAMEAIEYMVTSGVRAEVISYE